MRGWPPRPPCYMSTHGLPTGPRAGRGCSRRKTGRNTTAARGPTASAQCPSVLSHGSGTQRRPKVRLPGNDNRRPDGYVDPASVPLPESRDSSVMSAARVPLPSSTGFTGATARTTSMRDSSVLPDGGLGQENVESWLRADHDGISKSQCCGRSTVATSSPGLTGPGVRLRKRGVLASMLRHSAKEVGLTAGGDTSQFLSHLWCNTLHADGAKVISNHRVPYGEKDAQIGRAHV